MNRGFKLVPGVPKKTLLKDKCEYLAKKRFFGTPCINKVMQKKWQLYFLKIIEQGFL